jgi:hypothetical protein
MHQSDSLQCTRHYAQIASTCRDDWDWLGVGPSFSTIIFQHWSSSIAALQMHLRPTTDLFRVSQPLPPGWTAQARMQSRPVST